MQNLKKLRELAKLTQQQLAEKIQVKQQAISLYEKQKIEPDIQTLIKLADYFEVSVDYLLKHRTQQLDISLATEQQKDLIKLILDLNNFECKAVEAYIYGLTEAKKEYYKKTKGE